MPGAEGNAVLAAGSVACAACDAFGRPWPRGPKRAATRSNLPLSGATWVTAKRALGADHSA